MKFLGKMKVLRTLKRSLAQIAKKCEQSQKTVTTLDEASGLTSISGIRSDEIQQEKHFRKNRVREKWEKSTSETVKAVDTKNGER